MTTPVPSDIDGSAGVTDELVEPVLIADEKGVVLIRSGDGPALKALFDAMDKPPVGKKALAFVPQSALTILRAERDEAREANKQLETVADYAAELEDKLDAAESSLVAEKQLATWLTHDRDEWKNKARRQPNASREQVYLDRAEALEQRVAALVGAPDEIERLKRCISMAMGCINPEATDRDLRLAWFRLADALDGKEPRAALAKTVEG